MQNEAMDCNQVRSDHGPFRNRMRKVVGTGSDCPRLPLHQEQHTHGNCENRQ
jgi:hypothetical protein